MLFSRSDISSDLFLDTQVTDNQFITILYIQK